jgi:hypothetical protein
MQAKLPRCVFELNRFASRDVCRSSLLFIYVEQTGAENHYSAIATDGHRLGKVDFVLEHGHGLPKRFGIDAKACVEILKGAKKDTEFFVEVEELTDLERDCSSVDTKARLSAGNKIVQSEAIGQFPDYRQVIPEHNDSGVHEIGVNPEYIGDVATYLKKCGEATGIKLVLGKDEYSPMRIERECADWSLVYVVMPMSM